MRTRVRFPPPPPTPHPRPSGRGVVSPASPYVLVANLYHSAENRHATRRLDEGGEDTELPGDRDVIHDQAVDRCIRRVVSRGHTATVGRRPGHAEAGRQAADRAGLDRRGDLFRHGHGSRHDERDPGFINGRRRRAESRVRQHRDRCCGSLDGRHPVHEPQHQPRRGSSGGARGHAARADAQIADTREAETGPADRIRRAADGVELRAPQGQARDVLGMLRNRAAGPAHGGGPEHRDACGAEQVLRIAPCDAARRACDVRPSGVAEQRRQACTTRRRIHRRRAQLQGRGRAGELHLLHPRRRRT